MIVGVMVLGMTLVVRLRIVPGASTPVAPIPPPASVPHGDEKSENSLLEELGRHGADALDEILSDC